jgi:hypothetical protein
MRNDRNAMRIKRNEQNEMCIDQNGMRNDRNAMRIERNELEFKANCVTAIFLNISPSSTTNFCPGTNDSDVDRFYCI